MGNSRGGEFQGRKWLGRGGSEGKGIPGKGDFEGEGSEREEDFVKEDSRGAVLGKAN